MSIQLSMEVTRGGFTTRQSKEGTCCSGDTRQQHCMSQLSLKDTGQIPWTVSLLFSDLKGKSCVRCLLPTLPVEHPPNTMLDGTALLWVGWFTASRTQEQRCCQRIFSLWKENQFMISLYHVLFKYLVTASSDLSTVS